MNKYKMVDTWEIEDSYILNEKELLKLAYDLYCYTYSEEELKQASEKFDSDIPKT